MLEKLKLTQDFLDLLDGDYIGVAVAVAIFFIGRAIRKWAKK